MPYYYFSTEVSINGRVIRAEIKYCYIRNIDDGSELPCTLKGKFKLDYRQKKEKLTTTDVIVVGDTVAYDDLGDGTGLITSIHPRENYLARKAPKIKGAGKRGERFEQILAANIDQFFVVVSADQPQFNNKTLDRFLITGDSSHIPTHVVINKIDLIEDDAFDFWPALYEDLGYECYMTSIQAPKSLRALREKLQGKISLFWGPSGVGKSSILNELFPELCLRTETVSDFSNKGRHTTTGVYMYTPSGDTFVIDTPGVREIEPYGIKKEDLAHYFTEFVPYINECKYNRCTHEHEPGCAIMEAVEQGEISPERYDSYARLLATIEDDLYF
ncbi:MAG: ribosome small subunit-dependent GTPase A [Ignavibacteria bacterium]|nr:ribosome small subunit-dependent GTPase A [Ignavibacteria bacterium]